MGEATKTEPTLEAKAEAVLAQLLRLADTTPHGVSLRGGGKEFSADESFSAGKPWRVVVPREDQWSEVVDVLYDMLCVSRGREWR